MGKLFQRKLSHLPSLIKIPGTQSLKREHRRCYRITPHPSPSSSLFFFPLSVLFPSRFFLPPFLPALETWELLLRRMKNIIIFLTALIGWDNIIFLLTRLIWSIFLPPLLFQTLTFPHSLSLSCALSLDLNLISFWGIWIWIPVFIQVWGIGSWKKLLRESTHLFHLPSASTSLIISSSRAGVRSWPNICRMPPTMDASMKLLPWANASNARLRTGKEK